MAIMFVDANPFPKYSGGMENWLFHLIKEINQRGRPLVVFASKSEGTPFYELRPYSNLQLIELPRIEGFNRPYAAMKRVCPPLAFVPIGLTYVFWTIGAWRIIRRHVTKQDRLVALHIIPAMLPLVLLRCFGGSTPVTCSARGKPGEDLKELNRPILAWFYTLAEKAILMFASQVISNGKDTAAYVRRDLGRDTMVIPNGVDFARFASLDSHSGQERNPWLEELLRLRQQEVALVMTVGTLRDVKGIRFLVEAAANLHREFAVQFRIIFIGKGDPSGYEEYGKAIGVPDRLLFVGEQQDVPGFLRLADVAVAISGGGGVSNALLEMMAAGRPIVAWDNLTYSQALTHGESGHLVKARDSAELAKGILCLLNDPEYASSLGKAAQEVAKGYDWQIIADKFLEAINIP